MDDVDALIESLEEEGFTIKDPVLEQLMCQGAAALRELQGERDEAERQRNVLEGLEKLATESARTWQDAYIGACSERDALKAENADLKTEIHYLRLFGNNDCTAMADAALAARVE